MAVTGPVWGLETGLYVAAPPGPQPSRGLAGVQCGRRQAPGESAATGDHKKAGDPLHPRGQPRQGTQGEGGEPASPGCKPGHGTHEEVGAPCNPGPSVRTGPRKSRGRRLGAERASREVPRSGADDARCSQAGRPQPASCRASSRETCRHPGPAPLAPSAWTHYSESSFPAVSAQPPGTGSGLPGRPPALPRTHILHPGPRRHRLTPEAEAPPDGLLHLRWTRTAPEDRRLWRRPPRAQTHPLQDPPRPRHTLLRTCSASGPASFTPS